MSIESVQEAIANALSRASRKDSVKLVAVSKGRSPEQIEALYQGGILDFGENRLDELDRKRALLPASIRWHYIGHLQSNKAKKALAGIELIHSVDSLSLAKKLDSLCQAANIQKSVLLQVNCSQEAQKQGFLPQDLPALFGELASCTRLTFCGLMTMAACHQDGSAREQQLTRNSFQRLFGLRQKLHDEYPECRSTLTELSMGMSQDFEIAIVEGATIVRIGRLLFE